MPTYEYECKSCGHTFEAFQAMSDAPLTECPQCGKEIRRLIFGGTGVIFKGSGFYVTDKGKGSSATAGAKNASKTSSSDAADSAPSKDAPQKDVSKKPEAAAAVEKAAAPKSA